MRVDFVMVLVASAL